MKLSVVYYLDYQNNDNIIVKKSFKNKKNATEEIEKIALEFIKDQQGSQQLEKCKQYEKTSDEIQQDVNLSDGLYLIKSGDDFVVLNKKKNVDSGILWNSTTVILNKIGVFKTTEFDLNFDLESYLKKEFDSTNQNKLKPANNFVQKNYTFLNELIDDFISGKKKLNPIRPH